MKLRSKDIIAGLFHSLGYKLEPIRTKTTAGSLPSDPFAAQQAILNRLGSDAPIILDVGANKGDTAEHYRKLLPKSTVHCFEPFPETLSILSSRFESDDHVLINPKAVSKEQGETSFFVNNAAATNSLLPSQEESQRFYPDQTKPKDEIKVPTIDLDTYALDNKIDHIDILKLDIQGGELLAISGANDLLSKQRIDLIYAEIQFVPLYQGAAQFDELWSALKGFGYTLYDVYDLHRSPGGQLLYGDALFVSKKCKEQVINTLQINE